MKGEVKKDTQGKRNKQKYEELVQHSSRTIEKKKTT